MNKVVTVNLNGNAYQLEESGYDALRAYLDGAAAKLAGNPDREEIIADIEQAIADKLRSVLGPYKTVATRVQVDAIISEMGPVEAGPEAAPNDEPPKAKPDPAGSAPNSGTAGPARRLYRLYDGAMISGVCNGLAAYLNLDPTIVRLVFVVVTIFSAGTALLAYLIMAWLVPVAHTEAEKNAACGTAPFTAQEFIRRARTGYYESMKGFPDREARRAWQRQFREEMRDWRRQFKWQARMGAHTWHGYWQDYWAAHPRLVAGWGIALPFLTLFNAVLTLGFIVAVVLLLTNGSIGSQLPPPGVPVWLAIVILMIAYNIIVWPLKAVRHMYYHYGVLTAHPGPRVLVTLWDSVVWLAFFGVLVWLACQNFPQVQAAVHNLPAVFREGVDNVKQWWSHQ